MPQSFSSVLIHLVFSTKGRAPVLLPDVRAQLYPYLGGILRGIGCPSLQMGGVEDHVHLLLSQSRTESLAHVVERLKSHSSKWLKDNGGGGEFAWQSGYGAFSVAAGDVRGVSQYIQNQEEHHRRLSFQEEYRDLLAIAGIEFDERYMWD